MEIQQEFKDLLKLFNEFIVKYMIVRWNLRWRVLTEILP
jgi:hypothetical protein